MRETVTATGRRRNRWLLLVAMTALGLGLVGMGAIAQEYPYGSALLLQFGSTLVLVAPLFFVERQLNARVEALHAALRGITFAPGVSSRFQSELAPQLQSYQEYLRGIGYEVDRRPVTIVTASSQDRPILSSTMATYSAAENEMLIDVRYVRQPGVMLRAYSHHILNLNTSSPSSATRGPWGSRIGSALAFYLPAAASNDPNLLSALGFGSLSDQVEIDRVQAEQWTDPVEVGWHWAKVFGSYGPA